MDNTQPQRKRGRARKQNLDEKSSILSLSEDLTKKLNADEGYEVESFVKWGPISNFRVFDIVIRKDGFVNAVIEVRNSNESMANSVFHIAGAVFRDTSASLLIVYYGIGDTFFVQERDSYTKTGFSFTEIKSLDSVVDLIKKTPKTVPETIYSRTDDKNKNDNKIELKFYNEKVLDPQWCREQLGIFTNDICRYSSLDSLFSTLKYGSFRMNGLPGMNDKDEGLLSWNLINVVNRLPTDTVKLRKGLINNAFIISYSSKDKIDDLTQWRLYGDDAKGVCCVFSVRTDKIAERFFLHPIKYIDIPNDGNSTSDDLLAELKKYVDNQSDLKYSDISPIIFYYKHKNYEPEAEVRLLVDNKKTSAYSTPPYKREWLLTYSNNIPNPYIDIPIKDFPLKLEKILLGPNMNDIDTIQVQLETMLSQLGIDAVVEPSKITNYRNPTK